VSKHADDARLLEELEALAADERASLAAAGRVDAPPGRAEAALRAHVGRAPAAPVTPAPVLPVARATRRAARGAFLAAAALVALLGLVAVRAWNDARRDDAHRLLGEDAVLVHPRGAVERYAPFRWDVACPEGGHFVVRVEGAGLSVESPWLRERTWTPDDTSGWPARIRWTLEVHRASGPGDLVASYVAWAER
jgi:hypothetical protein